MGYKERLRPVLQGFFAAVCVLLFLVFVVGTFLGNGQPGGYFLNSISSTNGRDSYTRSRLNTLHSALISYSSDLGHFPHLRKIAFQPPQVIRECYDKAGIVLDPKVASRNVLLQPVIDAVPGWEYLGLASETYQKRWKGPYLEAESVCLDGWDRPIRYCTHENRIFLHSAGKDGVYAPVSEILSSEFSGDDIILAVSRFQKR